MKNLGIVGGLAVDAFCGAKGWRESYQISGPQGIVQFTWVEWADIKKLIEDHHDEYHPDEKPIERRRGTDRRGQRSQRGV